MENTASEKGWQELEARIQQLHAKCFREDRHDREYEPRQKQHTSLGMSYSYGEE